MGEHSCKFCGGGAWLGRIVEGRGGQDREKLPKILETRPCQHDLEIVLEHGWKALREAHLEHDRWILEERFKELEATRKEGSRTSTVSTGAGGTSESLALAGSPPAPPFPHPPAPDGTIERRTCL